ncbi:MAG: universal stress protein [Bacteroidales bacterium]|nr:universal stress protein [Bacteroidales bacterium]
MEFKRVVLVPWDFTQIAENAFQHAINVAKTVKDAITLIHIVKKDKEVNEATIKLNDTATELKKKYGIKPEIMVKVGSIFTTITEATEEIDADMVIMGTHGMKGMQKITGSWALKVIAGTHIPFLVVQGPPKKETFDEVVFPIDFKKENKEKVNWVVYLARHFHNPKFHIFKSKNNDPRLVKAVESNVIFTRRILDVQRVNYSLTQAEGKKDFTRETLDFAEEKKADLLLIITTKDITIADYMLGAHEQQIIANEAGIPVMCINPRPSKVSSFNASGG